MIKLNCLSDLIVLSVTFIPEKGNFHEVVLAATKLIYRIVIPSCNRF
jgi:hypothetical protein